MKLTLQCVREVDGRWLAEVPQLPGVMAYGSTQIDALGKTQILALRVLAERIEEGGIAPSDIHLSIICAEAAQSSPPPDESGTHAAWLAAEVQEALDDDAPTIPHEEAMRQIRAAVFAK